MIIIYVNKPRSKYICLMGNKLCGKTWRDVGLNERGKIHIFSWLEKRTE